MLAAVDDPSFGSRVMGQFGVTKAKLERAIKDVRGSKRVLGTASPLPTCPSSPFLSDAVHATPFSHQPAYMHDVRMHGVCLGSAAARHALRTLLVTMSSAPVCPRSAPRHDGIAAHTQEYSQSHSLPSNRGGQHLGAPSAPISL